jgi:hypothetical protein
MPENGVCATREATERIIREEVYRNAKEPQEEDG